MENRRTINHRVIQQKTTHRPQGMRIVIAIAALFILGLTSCNRTHKNSDTRPVISVSIFPVKTIIDRLSDQYYQVNVMIPKNIGHSDYSPTARQMKDLSTSKAYLAIGPLDFELTWGERLRSVSQEMAWIDLSNGIDLIDGHVCNHEGDEHHHHTAAYDPHYWMSPLSAMKMVENIKDELIRLNPEIKSVVEKNHQALQLEMNAIHQELISVAEANDSLTFMIYHPALGYLARDYGFNQLEMEENGKAPTPVGLKRQIERARDMNVKIMFVQQNFDVNNAKTAAEEIGARIIQINPESEAWLEELQQIANHLKEVQ